jgi:hypothetical protein
VAIALAHVSAGLNSIITDTVSSLRLAIRDLFVPCSVARPFLPPLSAERKIRAAQERATDSRETISNQFIHA